LRGDSQISQKGSSTLPVVRKTETSPEQPSTNHSILYGCEHPETRPHSRGEICGGLIFASGKAVHLPHEVGTWQLFKTATRTDTEALTSF